MLLDSYSSKGRLSITSISKSDMKGLFAEDKVLSVYDNLKILILKHQR